MKEGLSLWRPVKTWGSRALAIALIAYSVHHWGMPLYRQYLVPKKKAVFVPTAKVKQGKFIISFHEIGNVNAERSVSVNSEIEGKITYIVPEGTSVKAGDRLVTLDPSGIERDIETKRLAYEQKKADVTRAKSALELLKAQNQTDQEQARVQLQFNQAELERAQSNLEKKKRLADEKLIPRDQVESAELEVRTKTVEVRKGEMALALKEKEGKSNEQQKEADVRTAEVLAQGSKMDMERSISDLKKAIITAPAAGMVTINEGWFGGDSERKYKEGDQVWRGRSICELPDLSSMQVKVQVGESDAPKVHLNTPVLFKLEAVPTRTFHGTVKEISQLATEGSWWRTGGQPGKRNFEVTIAVKEVDPKTLKPGMTADVEFVQATINNAVYIPIEAVIEKAGRTYVYVKEGRRYKQVYVKTGKSNDNFIIVTKGLKKDQVVALRDPTRLQDDQQTGPSGKTDKEAVGTESKSPVAAPSKANR